jgi:acyl-CoA synthetase (AMP-forming)/AMP-acid ligase II
MSVTGNPAARSTAAGPLEIPDLRVPEFVLSQARSRGAKAALVEADSGREISYAQLADAVAGTAHWLAGEGVHPGDVVALCAPNSIEFVIAWYAASSAGAVITPVNPILPDEELAGHFRRTGTRWLITTEDLFTSKLAAVAEVTGIVEPFVLGAGPELLNARRLDAVGLAASGGVAPALPAVGDDVALLSPSSGTTGLPKIVVLTHRSLVASLVSMAGAQWVAESDVTLALPPMFHIYGLQSPFNQGLLQGATVVMLSRFELGAFLRAIQDYEVTRAEIVPPVAVQLAKSELVNEFDLSSLRHIVSAAAPLSPDVIRACVQRFGVRVLQAMGLTEAGGGTHFGLTDGPDRPDMVGPAIPGVECRVVDTETGKELGPDEPGELLVRGPGVMRGYLDDPEATAAAIDGDGWLHTGDIVTVDSDGWYRVTDRIKELIKYKGYQVAPAELEDVLLAHPAVADAAVVRSPDEAAGEVPKAFVVRKPGTDPVDAQELMTWVADRVAPYKRVRRVEFTDSIPKSATGKILRRHLIEREYQANAPKRTSPAWSCSLAAAGAGSGGCWPSSWPRSARRLGCCRAPSASCPRWLPRSS